MTAEKKFSMITEPLGLGPVHYTYTGDTTFARMSEGKRKPSSTIYASLVKAAHDFRRFDEEFELLSRDFLQDHIEMMPHQLQAAKMVFTEMNLRAILADEVGLGKTIEAGIIAKELQMRGMLQNMLILAPKTLIPQWEEEFREKFGIRLWDVGEKGTNNSFPFWIANSKSWYWGNSALREPIFKRKWDLVIIDEAHHFKNRKGKGYDALSDSGSRGIQHKYLLLLTATPIQNDLQELYSLLHLVRPGALGSYRDFTNRYFGDKKGQVVQNEKHLQRLVRQNMIRRRRIECGIDYSAREPHIHALIPTKSHYEVYRLILELQDTLSALALRKVAWLRSASSSISALTETLDNSSLREEPRYKRIWEAARRAKEEGEPKMAKLQEIASRHDRIVVFTDFAPTQKALKRDLENAGFIVHELHGQLTTPQRRLAVRNFKDKGGVFLSLPAGSEGLNLQFSNVVVNYDLPWNPMRVEQRIGRVHRIGQKDRVYVHTLSYAGTIEDFVLTTLFRKLKLFQLSVGEIDDLFTRGTGDDDFELESELRRLVTTDRASLDKIRERLEFLAKKLEQARSTPLTNDQRFAGVLEGGA